MPQRKNDCDETIDQRQEMVQQETILRNAHEEGNETVADHFIWSETKMKNHNDNGR